MRQVIFYVAMSLDGYIARTDGRLDWLEKYNEDYGYKVFLDSIDIIIMGNTTYKQILTFGEFPYKDKKCFVLSRGQGKGDHVKFITDLKKVEKMDGKIWLVGGADLANQFLENKMIDKMIISIMPLILGDGIRLFDKQREIGLELKNSKEFKTGVVQLEFNIKKN